MGRGAVSGAMGPPQFMNNQRPGSGYGPNPVLAQANQMPMVQHAAGEIPAGGINNATGNMNQCEY